MVDRQMKQCCARAASRGRTQMRFCGCAGCVQSRRCPVAAVTGADLKKRIEEIMANRKMYGPACGRKLLLAGAAVLALIVPVVIGLVDVSQVRAQSATNPAFEVASVKLHVGGTDRKTLVPATVLGGGTNVYRFLLAFVNSHAYNISFTKNAMMTGIPHCA